MVHDEKPAFADGYANRALPTWPQAEFLPQWRPWSRP